MTTTMTDTKYLSTADKCRAALKAAGFKANQVTVKSPHGSVYVTIRTADVSLLAVEAVVMQFENKRYCQSSQELLSHSTAVYVRYAPEVLEPLAAEIAAVLVATPERISVEIGPHEVFWEPSYGPSATPDHNSTIHTRTEMITQEGRTMRACGLDFGSKALATDLLTRGIKTLRATAQV